MLGLAAGILIVAGGLAALGLFDIPQHLHDQARTGVVAVGITTVLAWPMKTFHDALRGSERFVLAAAAEATGYFTFAVAQVVLALLDAPLWILVAVGGAVPLAIGSAAAVVQTVAGLGFRFRPGEVSLEAVVRYFRFSGYLLFAAGTDVIIYSLDRAVLGAFRGAAAVGLYEGPIRAHNLIRTLNATLMGTVLPAASRYAAERDVERQRALLVRGSRYTAAAVTTLTVVLMVLSGPILEVWLGPRYAVAGTAMTIFVAYWLVGGSAGVPAYMVMAAGHVRWLAGYAWAHAILSLSLSIALTAWLGLEGVVLGTTVAYLAMAPLLFRKTWSVIPVPPREFAREVWLPAYSTGLLLAGALVALRLTVGLDTLPTLLAAAAAGLAGYWALFYRVWLLPSERTLVRSVALAPLRRA
jgi:O-antigen/teichoic acid export membrane protein